MLPIAAGHRTGLMRFDPGPQAQTGWGGVVTDERAGTVLVAMLPLDALLPGDFHAAVLKIDVEGADTWVLQGCQRLLAERRAGVVFFEQNLPRLRALGIEPDAAQHLLTTLGYRVTPITPVDAEVVEYAAYPVSWRQLLDISIRKPWRFQAACARALAASMSGAASVRMSCESSGSKSARPSQRGQFAGRRTRIGASPCA